MPLDAEYEARVGQLDRLGEVIAGRASGYDQAVTELVDRLVMVRLRHRLLAARRLGGQ
jgi:hypothetical protein